MSFPNLGYSRISDRLRLPGTFRSFATSFVGSWCLGILTYTLPSLILFSLEILDDLFPPTLVVKELTDTRRFARSVNASPLVGRDAAERSWVAPKGLRVSPVLAAFAGADQWSTPPDGGCFP